MFSLRLHYLAGLLGVFCVASAIAAKKEAPTDGKPPPAVRVQPAFDDHAARLKALGATMPKAEVHWLTAEDKEFLTLYRPAAGAQPLGAILIVPDHGMHPAWPNLVQPLRYYLARHGWHTLSLAVPQQKAAVLVRPATPKSPPPDKKKKKEAAEPATETTPTDTKATTPAAMVKPEKKPSAQMQQNVQQRINSGIAFLQQQLSQSASSPTKTATTGKPPEEKPIFAIGIGAGAHWLAMLPEAQLTMLSGLVLIDLQATPTEPVSMAHTTLTAVKHPTLEVVFNSHHPLVQKDTQRRRGLARRQYNLHQFYSISASHPKFYSENNRLFKRLRGWLLRWQGYWLQEKAREKKEGQ